MKALKLSSRIVFAVAFSFLVINFFILIFTTTNSVTFSILFLNLLPVAALSIVIGFALSFLDNKLAHYLGFGIEGAGYLIFIVLYALLANGINNEGIVIATFILYWFSFAGFIATIILDIVAEKAANKPAKSTGEDLAMEKLIKWKRLLDSNIITTEEFEVKKKEILISMVEEQE